jgi:peptide/nickel transport system substrate-binding protein
VSWRRGESLTLEANPDFSPSLGGRPYLDRIVFRIIPEQTTLTTELLTGSVDHAGVPFAQEDEVRRQARVELRSAPSASFLYIGWNGERPQFNDPRTRRALTMGIDRQGMIDAFLYGHGTIVDGVIPRWHPMYTDIPPLPYDPEGARRLLAEVGWRDLNGDGVLEKDGKPFVFTLLVNAASGTMEDMATAMHQQLERIGVDLRIQAVEFQTLIRQHRSRDYDAALGNWGLDTFRVDPTALFSCVEARKPGSVNRAGYCSDRADELMTEGQRTVDPDRARAVWADFSRVLQQDQPMTFLVWPEILAGVNPRLRNVEVDVRGTLVNPREWWIPAGERRAGE